MTTFATWPKCTCGVPMLRDVDGDYYCANEDCNEVSQLYTRREIENREAAAGERAQQTGVDAFEGGFAADN